MIAHEIGEAVLSIACVALAEEVHPGEPEDDDDDEMHPDEPDEGGNEPEASNVLPLGAA
jgi:hypothetical protein